MVGQDTNTTWGVSSNSGVGSGVHLTFGADKGTGTEFTVSTGVGMGMRVLWVAGGLRVACSWE